MRPFNISTIIFLLIIFATATWSAKDVNSTTAAESQEPNNVQDNPAEQIADTNVPADSNTVIDPKDPAFGELNKFLNNFEKRFKRDTREWTKGNIAKRRTLVKSIQARAKKEFDILRKIAEQEKALKTTAAIDRLTKARSQRFENILQRLKEAEKQQKQKGKGRQKKDSSRRDGGKTRQKGKSRTRETTHRR